VAIRGWQTFSAPLRRLLVTCPYRAYDYLGLKAKKGHKIAIVATARKLLHIVWAVLVRQEKYRDLQKDSPKNGIGSV